MAALFHPTVPLLLEDYVNVMLQSSDSPQLRNLHCQTRGSEVILRGSVTSPDVKHLAQQMVQSACGMRAIANEIVVQNEVP
jgi:osmotically-inducible protein OsmY